MSRHKVGRAAAPDARPASSLLLLLAAVAVPAVLIGYSAQPALVAATTTALITMILVVGLQLFCGNSGVLAFGHVAFVAIGAYTCGILTIPVAAKRALLPNLPWMLGHVTISPQLGVLAGAAVAATISAIAFYPLRRLNAQALSIATLALLLVANVFFTNVRLSSSSGAITRVPMVATLWTVLPWLAVAIVVSFLFKHSRLGLRLRASREDEFAAASAGIDIGWTRFAAFVVSAGIMGLGGGLYALSLGSYSAADFFLDMTILLFAMMVVGGMRSLTGAVVGTALISAISYLFAQLQNGIAFGDVLLQVPVGTANLSVAMCMVVVLLFSRDGLLRGREIRFPDLAARRDVAAAGVPRSP